MRGVGGGAEAVASACLRTVQITAMTVLHVHEKVVTIFCNSLAPCQLSIIA